MPDDDFGAGSASWDDIYQGEEPPRALASEDGVFRSWVCPASGGICRKPRPGEDAAFVSHRAWDGDRKVRFLHHLSEKGDVRAAAARVGMSRQSAYLLRRRDGGFAQGWQAALVLARRHAEEVLATRALDGIEEAVWFRGELVGKKRRYDTRLLLAHLARLDRMAEEAGACEDRFDEMLAMVAGERPEAHFAEADAEALDADRRVLEEDRALEGWGGAHDPLPLPPGRAAFVLSRAEPAWIAANGAWDEAAGAVERAYEEEHGYAPHEEDRPEHLPDPDYPPLPLYTAFRDASAAQWDGWQGCAFGRVDAAMTGAAASHVPPVTGGPSPSGADAGAASASGKPTPDPSRTRDGDDAPMEYKSLGGPGGGFSSGPCQPCQPARGAGKNRGGRERIARRGVIGGEGWRSDHPAPLLTLRRPDFFPKVPVRQPGAVS